MGGRRCSISSHRSHLDTDRLCDLKRFEAFNDIKIVITAVPLNPASSIIPLDVSVKYGNHRFAQDYFSAIKRKIHRRCTR